MLRLGVLYWPKMSSYRSVRKSEEKELAPLYQKDPLIPVWGPRKPLHRSCFKRPYMGGMCADSLQLLQLRICRAPTHVWAVLPEPLLGEDGQVALLEAGGTPLTHNLCRGVSLSFLAG